MSSQLVGIAERYDRELAGVTDEALKRVFAAYDASYRNLVKSLRDAFPRLEQAGSISTLVRQGAIAAELGEALKFIDPEAAKELEALGRDTIRQAGELGQQLAGDTLNYVGVQSTFTTVPVGAVRNQAERFRERLVNYSDQQASTISAVVEQGLIQGWGTRKVEGQLRGLGVSFKSNAETVARTEVMSAYNGAARSRYEQSGVAYLQWIATPAEGTCSLCYARNTKVWKITEAPSVPAHPRCRCTTLPVSSLDQIDTAFYEAYSQDGLDDLARQKLAPDNGLTYWEKKAGATLAKPVWVPGQVIPKPEPVKDSKDNQSNPQQLKKISGQDGQDVQDQIKTGFRSWASSINQAYAQNVSGDLIFDVALIAESLATRKPQDIRAIIDNNGTMQAAACVRAKKDHLYVDLLATAPANVLQKAGITLNPPVNSVKGSGTQMMREIVLESLNKGFRGEVRLEALTGAVSFYEKMGFVITKKGSLPKMTLTPEKAIEFLNRTGGVP